ncbi:MAG: ABC transporter ATP-binding protein [Desulfobacterales bacterium]|jgi:branched-chain amino acid transport system ATP-binding protein
MTSPVLEVRRLVKSFGAVAATDGVELSIQPGEIHALIGPNGAGKTTLLNQIAGELRPDAGSIRFKGRPIDGLPVHRRTALGMARTYQVTSIFNGFDTLINVALGIQAREGHRFRLWKRVEDDHRLLGAAMDVLRRIGLEDHAHTRASNLSHGDQRKVGIAMALATCPDLLLLDEPMAGMGPRACEEMVDLLKSLKGRYSLLLIEHDMEAVFALADRISVLVYGRIIASGIPDDIRRNPSVQEAYLGDDSGVSCGRATDT